MKPKTNYFLTPVYALPKSTFFKRIGIIPYFKDELNLYSFLMLDSKYKQLTDCGGIPKLNENWIDTAIRETREESRNKFNFSYEQILNEGLVFWREDNMIAIIFINLSSKTFMKETAYEICYRYRLDYINGIASKDKRCTLENSDMFFYNIKEMQDLIRQHGRIYAPVRMLLMKFIRNHYDLYL